MAKKGKGFFGSIGSFLGSIPAVGKVKNAAKSVKKKIKNTKKKLKKALKKAKKKLKKKLKKKIGKVFTKARKLKNNLSKSKMVKKFKRTAKKVVLAAKQAAKKTSTKVKQAVKEVKAKVKETVVPLKPSKGKVEKISKKVGNKIQGEAELAKFFDEYLKDRKTVGPIGNKYSVQDGNPLTTLQDKRQVLSAPSTADPDGLAPYAVIGYKMFVEDFVTLANPNATLQERNEATLSALSPFGKAGKGKKVAEALKDMEKGLEAAQDFNKYANKGKDAQKATQKEKEQLGEYVNKGNGNSNDAYGGYYERKEQRTDDYNNKTGNWTPANKTTPPNGPYRTDKEADVAAEILGYKRVPGVKSHGRAVYTNGKEYISPDTPRKTTGSTDNGGVWNKANSPEDLFRKETRKGTYDKNLNRIGD
ncbi:toxin C-terminal domain-containing protein [Lysinibacillus sphaericus]|uniref:Novel toxin 21 domain-containing protein n=1 Tax=Lysinibacillus sphaericus OT4b.31 TaxID=1285586 RepID=R7Z7W0_LYSSH|nr:hypothetical protein H131_22279 [Lysinibacillus sphaericus OT4b.31]